jgi:chromosome segregation ATPase
MFKEATPLLDANDLNQIKNVMLEAIEPFLTKIYKKQLEHDDKFKQIDVRLDKLESRMDRVESRLDMLESRMVGLENRMGNLEKDTAEIKGFHKDLEKTLKTIKRLYTDLMFKVGKLEDRVHDLEKNPAQEDFKKKSTEIRQEFEALKDRVTKLENLIDRVCETEEKYKS